MQYEELINDLGFKMETSKEEWYRIEMCVRGICNINEYSSDMRIFALDSGYDVNALKTAIAFIKENHDAIFTKHALDDNDFFKKIVEANIPVPFAYGNSVHTIANIDFKYVFNRNLTSIPLELTGFSLEGE